jgi:hypothetical protein
MSRRIVTLLIFSLVLLGSSCSNESAFEPSQSTLTGDELQPSFNGGTGDDPEPRKSPGGSRGGWRR